MLVTPNDDIVEITKRCDSLRIALGNVNDDSIKTIPHKKYLYLCQVSGERPNPIFLSFTQDKSIYHINLQSSYLSQRSLLLILLTLPQCSWLQHINLREQRLTSTLIELLCESLREIPFLSTIDVSGNPFGSFGVRALLKLVLCKCTIIDCRIDGVQSTGGLLRRLHEACERNRRNRIEEKKEEDDDDDEENISTSSSFTSYNTLSGSIITT